MKDNEKVIARTLRAPESLVRAFDLYARIAEPHSANAHIVQAMFEYLNREEENNAQFKAMLGIFREGGE